MDRVPGAPPAGAVIEAPDFTTDERFTNTAAMDTHNNSAAVARFFATAKPILDGEVVLHICEEGCSA